MAQPVAYVPATDFSTDEAAAVSGRSTVRTANLDAEFSAVKTTTDQLRTNLAILQRDDTKLRDGAVELHTLSASVLALINSSGWTKNAAGYAWLTATVYAVNNFVTNGNDGYLCIVAHASGTFATDLAANKWVRITGVSYPDLASTAPTKGAALVGIEDAAGNFAATNMEAALAELVANLASTAVNKGASRVGIEDAAGNFAAINVEAALAEILANLASTASAKGAALVGNVTQIVNDMATLRTINVISGRSVWRKYHTTSGDGGQALFRGITGASPGTYVHNTGSVCVASGGDGSAAWVVDFSPDPVSVTLFGAAGLGGDYTANIQSALTAHRDISVPDGTYRLSATLTGRADQRIRGTTPERCVFQRTTAYGHTFTVGTDAVHAGSFVISGIWFNHTYAFNNGATYVAGTSTSATNKDPSSAQLKIVWGQNVRISDCWFYGCGYGIDLVDSTVIWIERCLFNGIWNVNVSGLQDTTAAIRARASVATNRCAIMHIHDNHIGGYAAGAATSVVTGNATVSHTLNAGIRYGILVNSCERFTINNNYIGGQAEHSILISADAICAHGAIHDNMLDGAGLYSIKVMSNAASYYMNHLVIHDNTGVGYGNDQGFLFCADNAGFRPATRVDVHDNVMQLYLKAPMRFERTRGLKIHNNTVAAYNSDNSTTADPYIEAGAVLDANCAYVRSNNNTWGGEVNDSNGGTNYCKWGIYFYSATNNSAALERSDGFGHAGGTVCGGVTMDYPV